MNQNMEEKIKKEFHWLQTNFPLQSITIDLYIRSLQAKAMQRNDIFLGDSFSHGRAEVNIFISFDIDNPLSQTDIFTINQLHIKKEYLPFWYLYHEYGHALEIDKHVKETGIENTRKWLENIENDLESTYYKSVLEYKETKEEKNADLFAIELYMNRVKEWCF